MAEAPAIVLPETEEDWRRLFDAMAQIALIHRIRQLEAACDARTKRAVQLLDRLTEIVTRTGITWDELETRLVLLLDEPAPGAIA